MNMNESTNTFKKIDVIQFFDQSSKWAVHYRKVVNVKARKANSGETVKTVTSGGHLETVNQAKNGDMLVMNPGGECYLIGAKTFKERYELMHSEFDSEGFATYRCVGKPIICIQLDPDEHVEFIAPWGAEMRINGGGFIANNGGTDVYGIQAPEFKKTYLPCFPNGELIPSDVWNQAYKKACQDAYETRMLQRISLSDKIVLRTTWEDAIVSAAATV